MHENTARMVSTVGIWGAVGTFLSVCAWAGHPDGGSVVALAGIGFGMAFVATGAVWRSAGSSSSSPTYLTVEPQPNGESAFRR